ncbi:MAG: hypothetical protein IJ583_18005, partial [Firmicutes bacterium]|nr:hypothetical protein [Bacillota bacterium]
NEIENDNALKYSSVLYIENYTKKLIETDNTYSEKLKDIYTQITNADSDIMKAKAEAEKNGAANLLVTKSSDEFANTQSGMGAKTLAENFLQKINDNYYFTSEMLIGKALSATYVPMRTNIYDNPNCDIANSDNYKMFDAKYGDLRKAVYISTSNKAVSQYYVTGKLSEYRPALLRDFIENTDDEKLFVTDPKYYNKDMFEKINFPENDERIDIKISKMSALDTNDGDKEKTEDQEVLPDDSDSTKNDSGTLKGEESTEEESAEATEETTEITTEEKEPVVEEVVKADTFLLDLIFPPETVYAAVSSMTSKEWVKAAENAKNNDEFSAPSTYYPESYMPYQDDLEDTINEGNLLKSYGGSGNVQEYLDAASSNSTSPVSYYIMHCLGWALRANKDNYKSNEISIPKTLYSESYFRDVMHFYIDRGQHTKFIDFCISQSILYKRVNFQGTPEAVKNLRNVIYSFSIEQQYRDMIFASFLYDLAVTDDKYIPDGAWEAVWFMITDNNAWQTQSGETKYAVVDPDTVRWMYSTGTDTSEGELYKKMALIRGLTVNKLNESGTVYKEIWAKNIPVLCNLLDIDGNVVNVTEDMRDDMGAWTDIVIAAFQSGPIKSYGNCLDMTKDERKELVKILPPTFAEAVNTYTDVQDAINSVKGINSIGDIITGAFEGISENALKRKEDSSDERDIKEDPILKRNGSMETIGEDDVNELSKNLAEYNSIKMFFPNWIESDFDIKQSKINQVVLLGSKALNDILTQEVLDTLDDTAYSVNKWYGIDFVLDVFRDSDLGKIISGSENKPIFRSSPNDYGGAYADSQFNWLLLKNIEETYPIRYDAVLDLDSPVFVDIYGNILTESGIVVVPFAANSTLHSNISLLNAAFLSSYGKKEYITQNEKTKSAYIGKTYINIDKQCMNYTTDYPAFAGTEPKQILIDDEENNRFILDPVMVVTDLGKVDIAKIDTVNTSAAMVLYNLALSAYTDNVSEEAYTAENGFINVESNISDILYQVLRGAELKNIDYEKEALNEGINFDRGTLSQALKYERLVDQLSAVSENSLITVPDLTTMDGVKYITFFIYKILIVVFTVYALLQVYLAASRQNFGIGTLLKIVVAFSCIGVCIFALPIVYKYSYYTVTRALLQDEASTIAMLNEEKRNNNVELGIISANNPNINSKLSLKVENIDIDYVSYIKAMIDVFDVKEMEDIYAREIEYSLETGVSEYELRGGALYHSIDDLFASSQIYVDTDTHKLKQVVDGEPAISFRMPYYAILDYLIYNINQYNNIIDSYDYGIQVTGDGRIRSIGLTERYFNSNAFNLTRDEILSNIEDYADMDSKIKDFALYDKAGIFAIYGSEGYESRNVFIDRTPFKNSQWYADELAGDDERIAELSEALDNEAILWIKNHNKVIGRISDETILKALALDLSLKYNELLNVSGPQKIEIESISTEDIIRLCSADTGLVLAASPYSYPKFILLTSGLAGVYIGAIITLVTFILGMVKPFVTIAAFIVLIASLVVLRVLFNKKTANIMGFIKFMLILAFINISYALGLKIFMILPEALPCLVRLILFLIMQMIYTALYIWITVVLVINWRDMGDAAFTNAILLKTLNIKTISTGKIENNSEKRSKEDSHSGWDIYNRLKRSDDYRKENRGKRPK